MLGLVLGIFILSCLAIVIGTPYLMYKDEQFAEAAHTIFIVLVVAWLLGTVVIHYLEVIYGL